MAPSTNRRPRGRVVTRRTVVRAGHPATRGAFASNWDGTLDRVTLLTRLRDAILRVDWRRVAVATGSAAARWVLRLGLPLAFITLIAHSFPYRTTVEGVPLQVQATVITRPGFSADTTIGNWVFPAVDGLPFGVHVSPQNVDLLTVANSASGDPAQFAQRLRDAMVDRLPEVVAWLAGEVVVGLGLGLAASAMINMAARYARGRQRRPDELKHRLRQLGAAGLVVVGVAAYGFLSYNPHWTRQSRLTGTLAAAQLFPDQLRSYYDQQSKVYDVLGSVTGIQAALQNQIDVSASPDTALRIMFISDVHLAAVYPLIGQYAASYHVDLIVNTGDESEFGTSAEMTPEFVGAISAVTRATPMLWLAGNHDSPAVANIMAAVPGVTVLGTKQAVTQGSTEGFSVSGGMVRAFGLAIAGVPDPRVYGGPGAFGSDDTKTVDALEKHWMTAATSPAKKSDLQYDIIATHEPVAAGYLRAALPNRIRQTNSGHTHAQNASGDIQHGDSVDLVEGSTGAGGLDNLVRGSDRPPVEFSIESVASNCQFTRAIRFQIRTPASGTTDQPGAYGNDVTATSVSFRPQKISADRVCGAFLGIGAETPLH